MPQLIVDNNELNRLIIKTLLERNNIVVDDVSNAEETFNLVKEDIEKYNIIWIDVNLPKIDGIECTKQLITKFNYTGQIIGIISHVDPDIIEECKKAGMSEVIPKPVTSDILKKLIKVSNPIVSPR